MLHRTAAIMGVIGVIAAAEVFATTSTAVNAERRRLSREGVRLVRQGQTERACEFFERANAYGFRPNAVWNVAECHAYSGRRDLAVAGYEKYIEFVPAAGASEAVQQMLWELEGEAPMMGDFAAGSGWGSRFAAAVEAAIAGEGTAITLDEQIFGTGRDSPGAPFRREALRRHGTDLFLEGLARVQRGDWDGALAFFERSLNYRQLRNAIFNIGEIWLFRGQRDLALHFFRYYVASLPALQADAGVASVLRELEDAPSRVGNEERRTEFSTRISAEISRALGEGGAGTASPSPNPQR